MPDYQKGKIYRIWDNGYNKCYIGSTCEELNRRMTGHRKNYKIHKRDGKGFTTADMMFDEYGIENCKIELMENFPCNTKAELHAGEGKHQRENDCINKNIAGRSMKQYCQDKKEHLGEYNKQRYQRKRDTILERQRQLWTCECGSTVTVGNKTHHKQTSKHQNYINQMNQQEQTNIS